MTRRNKQDGDIHLRLGENLFKKAQLLQLLRREKSMNAYIRRALERQIEEDLKDFPNVRLTARPKSTVYRVEGSTKADKVFIPLTETMGGERVWLINGIGSVPRSLGGGYAYLVDLTVRPGEEGFEGREVVMLASDILGGVR